ncbi:eukaryotic translation initiation factor 2-alpha kinase isoform X2 [Spodoptera frugiperda]|uniref:non-specific serine/threonine protein kinase n=1 Tax=Spodoptera frugiperda TaxID=7108 RepID=A0A9R0DZV3_SPOFR|nr:eukaryotic translation initiation factor 2-alpha kinase isoform X2 [Spodoptera frugiperda]
MSDWYWRVIALKATFALTFIFCNVRAEDTVQKLPYCNPTIEKDDTNLNDLVIVSTLDGRLTAFSTENGIKAWDLETQPLLSSNLHHVELTSGGKWVRLVPSLSGSLYSVSGDNIEPLPFDAEQLLSSSFKYSDDLVIAGSRETLWFGLDAHTGGIIYECGSGGCSTEQQTAYAGRDVIVLRRHSNTVRALDPRTGSEKWNFSVAEHRMALSRRECAGTPPSSVPVTVAVALPEGVVAVKDTTGTRISWKQKLDAPVAGMWRLHAGSLQAIDVLWEATQTLIQGDLAQQPSLYIGVHDTQLYIQESQYYSRKLETTVSAKPLPWKLVTARPQIEAETLDNGQTALSIQDADPNALSLITLYGNTGKQIGDHGYFVYLQETCDQSVQVSDDIFDSPNISEDMSDQHHIHVHVSSLWYWWKEVLLIAVSSALLMNLMIWPRMFAPKLPPSPLPTSNEQVIVQVYNWPSEKPGPSRPSIAEYSGRYETDFTSVRCLGRGGFGVVFEAKNNIDDCSYAVKRITLPRRESKRDRVLREVRALAKLDHEHIVRYFNAWVEEPPPDWQRQRDAELMKQLEGVSVAMSDEYTATSPVPAKSRHGDVRLNLNKSADYTEPSKRPSCNDSFSIVFDPNAPSTAEVTSSAPSVPPHVTNDDDSFIVFAHSQEGAEGTNGEETVEHNSSYDRRLERVKECDYKTESSCTGKKKKGHTRHWSLDMVVRDAGSQPPRGAGGEMYLYIQMQLCRRDSLHDWLRDNRCCQGRAEKVKVLFSQIVSAVEYVHLAGLIHRDLKPSNILFAPDGRVKVGDFGLVTAMTDTSQDGDTAQVMDVHQRHTYRVGTHLYMSPEQLCSRPYSYKVDIYSLGLLLFELLQPFHTEAERVACLTKLREHIYPPDFVREYPEETEVLKMMLSEDPSKRPTATGVRARAPLYQQTNPDYHFVLPAMAAA